jgi:hypothetical protein
MEIFSHPNICIKILDYMALQTQKIRDSARRVEEPWMILNITTRTGLYPTRVAGCIDFALIISQEKYETCDPPEVKFLL